MFFFIFYFLLRIEITDVHHSENETLENQTKQYVINLRFWQNVLFNVKNV